MAGLQTSPRLNHWLDRLVAESRSDLLLVAGVPTSIRVDGRLQAIDNEPLTGLEIEATVLRALTPHALEGNARTKIADSSYRVAGMRRFRIHLYQYQ